MVEGQPAATGLPVFFFFFFCQQQMIDVEQTGSVAYGGWECNYNVLMVRC